MVLNYQNLANTDNHKNTGTRTPGWIIANRGFQVDQCFRAVEGLCHQHSASSFSLNNPTPDRSSNCRISGFERRGAILEFGI